ncbi:stage III sporulation protein AE [Aureibacillus halotolerans]|uniref:Stage III sporulation protein AE n=1 Tax=Aureibacillus halotolerans TaxID=1508390 RepID=A0A4R6U7J5_9BACI|nr:stage III sporulation protein AE [Aureibacillus halotolerans]TDQ41652.1 stage III sporulation protein AE [Aureibacillus halotolerans]
MRSRWRIQPLILPFLTVFVVILSLTWPTTYTKAEMNAGMSPAEVTDAMMDKQLNHIDLEGIQTFWEDLSNQYDSFLPESHRTSLVDIIRNNEGIQFRDILPGVLRFLFQELLASGKLMGALVILTVLSMLLQSLQNAFEQKTVSQIAYAIIYMVLILLALNSFHIAMSYATEAISSMVHFMVALVPLLLAMMASVGALSSAALFHPVIIFLVNVSGIFIQHVVLPLLYISLLLGIISSMTEHYKVSQLSQLLRNIAIGALGVFLAVFLGVISVQGATTAVADGMLLKTAKFITGNFVPVVGRMFTDATDLVIGASVLLKNTIGLVGLAIIIMIAAFPAAKIFILAMVYKLTAALMQPLGGGPVIECLNIISKCMLFVFASLAIVSLMFFLALTIMITVSNVPIMVR